MKYDIVKADPSIGQIEVCYKDDAGNVLATYAIDVPIIDGKYISGQELDMEIISRGPRWLLERKELAKAAIGFESIIQQVVTADNDSIVMSHDQSSAILPTTVWTTSSINQLDDIMLTAKIQQVVSDMNNDSV